MKKKIKKLIIRKARVNRYDVDYDPFLEDLIVNSEETYDGFIAEGKSPKEAYQLTLNQIGDLDEYFKDKSISGQDLFEKQKSIHNLLSASFVLLAIVLVAIYYLVKKIHFLAFVSFDVLIFGILLGLRLKISKNVSCYQIFKNNIDQRFYFCTIANFLILIPVILRFDFNQYMMFTGINIFLMNLIYVLLIDRQIKPSFLLSIIALTISIIHYCYTIHSMLMIFLIMALIISGAIYIKLVLTKDILEYGIIFIGSLFIILALFLFELLKYFDIIFISLLVAICLFIIFYRKYSPDLKIAKIKSIISIGIIIYIIGAKIFILSHYLVNFYSPQFIPFTYVLYLYRPIIVLIIIEYLNNIIFNVVLNYYYKKKGVKYEETVANHINSAGVNN